MGALATSNVLYAGDFPNPLHTASDPPADALSYERVCLRPLPGNTFLDAIVHVDDTTADFFYSQQQEAGAALGNRKWVCRTKVQNPNVSGSSEDAGTAVDRVEIIDPNQYDAQPTDPSTPSGCPSWLPSFFCGGDLSLSTKITLGVVGLVAFVLVLVFLFPGRAA